MLFALQVLIACTFVAFGANTQAHDSARGGRALRGAHRLDLTPMSASMLDWASVPRYTVSGTIRAGQSPLRVELPEGPPHGGPSRVWTPRAGLEPASVTMDSRLLYRVELPRGRASDLSLSDIKRKTLFHACPKRRVRESRSAAPAFTIDPERALSRRLVSWRV